MLQAYKYLMLNVILNISINHFLNYNCNIFIHLYTTSYMNINYLEFKLNDSASNNIHFFKNSVLKY